MADSSKFVVAYPDGVNRAWNVNGGGCCGRPAREGIDDVGFITAAVADIATNVSIDASRVYATGMSNGGMMSYTLACDTSSSPRSARFPAHSWTRAGHRIRCRSWRFTAPRIRWFLTAAGPAAASPTSTAHRYRSRMRSGARSINASTPVETTSGSVTTSTAGCPDNRSVVLVTVDGGGHHWPDFATAKLWQFFAAHPR